MKKAIVSMVGGFLVMGGVATFANMGKPTEKNARSATGGYQEAATRDQKQMPPTNSAEQTKIVHPRPGQYQEGVEIIHKANAPSDPLLTRDQIEAKFTPTAQGKRVAYSLMTWGELQASVGSQDRVGIDDARKVWVILTYFSEGRQVSRGKQIPNCVVVSAVDAVTGKGYSNDYIPLPVGATPESLPNFGLPGPFPKNQ